MELCNVPFESYDSYYYLLLLYLHHYSIYRSIVESDNSLTNEIGGMIVPRVPMGISGTALAASLLRDGWSVRPSIVLLSFLSVKDFIFFFVLSTACKDV